MGQAQKLSGMGIGAAAVFCAVAPVWANATPSSASQPDVEVAQRTGDTTAPAATPISQTPANPPPQPSVQVPQPNIRINGNPATDAGAVQPVAPVPPFLPRAIAPPVGDISVSNIDPSASSINLGTTARIPRLVLKDAPVREVLELLSRSAGLNLAFIEGSTPAQPGQAAQATQAASTITLNIENESVQDVFNYVLQISRLQANRIGGTIFVGSDLPVGVRNVIVRTFRLNQVPVAQAAAFLTAQGAERQIAGAANSTVALVNNPPRTTTQGGTSSFRALTTTATNQEGLASSKIVTTGTTLTRSTVEGLSGPSAPFLLKGVLVTTDERLNTVTVIGEPRQVEIATALLTQLDLRRRQVAMNVKIIDVNLLNTDNFGASFSFGLGNNSFVFDRGAAVFNFGSGTPTSASSDPANPLPPLNFASRFLARLQASISSGNAKVLSDPTLVVQESETATVNLSQEVFGGFTTRFENLGTPERPNLVQISEPIIKGAGLILNIGVIGIDDNGFVTLNVNPTVSAIGGSAQTSQGEITLLQLRTLESGRIRLRDGQTLILSGIIQESDRTTVSKVPILGDIPILGALFRSTNRSNGRQEVIVLLTPQIIDDSAGSSFGYNYTPGPDAGQLLRQTASPTTGGNR